MSISLGQIAIRFCMGLFYTARRLCSLEQNCGFRRRGRGSRSRRCPKPTPGHPGAPARRAGAGGGVAEGGHRGVSSRQIQGSHTPGGQPPHGGRRIRRQEHHQTAWIAGNGRIVPSSWHGGLGPARTAVVVRPQHNVSVAHSVFCGGTRGLLRCASIVQREVFVASDWARGARAESASRTIFARSVQL